MAKRLKTYQTSSGFLAVAAPSMKAAAEAWGSRTNLEPPSNDHPFHRLGMIVPYRTKHPHCRPNFVGAAFLGLHHRPIAEGLFGALLRGGVPSGCAQRGRPLPSGPQTK